MSARPRCCNRSPASRAESPEGLDGPDFCRFLQRMSSDPDMKKSLAETKIDVFGHVDEGEDTAHVIYRSTVKLGENDIQRLNVATLRKNGQTWKMVIPDEFAGPMRRARRATPRCTSPTPRLSRSGMCSMGRPAR